MNRPDRLYSTPKGRRAAIAARTAATEAKALTDANLACVLTVWTPTFLNGYPLDRDHDTRPA